MKHLYLGIALVSSLLFGCAREQADGSGGTGFTVASDQSSFVDPAPIADNCPTNTVETLQFIIPCKTKVNNLPEVLAKNDKIISIIVKTGNNIAYIILQAGNYVSQDGRNCQYKVTAQGEVFDLN